MVTVISNIHVLGTQGFSEPMQVIINGNVIGANTIEGEQLDGAGGYLIPGLIDAHVHLHSAHHLDLLARAGVTTAFDMGAWMSDITKLRTLIASSGDRNIGLPDIRSAGCVMTAPGAGHSKFPGLPPDTIVNTPSAAREFVHIRASQGSDYIKLIADIPGPSQSCLDAATEEAKKLGLMVIIHACTYETYRMAIMAQPHVITHAPMDQALTETDAREMVRHGIACVPTLSMMRLAKNPIWDYANAVSSVSVMHRCGVLLMAGSDAVDYPGAPSGHVHGESLHVEFKLLVDAGLSNLDVLASATRHPAEYFRLHDRGKLEIGFRADAVLLRDDPSVDISALDAIVQVWCNGNPYRE